jgi:hypothetical protein
MRWLELHCHGPAKLLDNITSGWDLRNVILHNIVNQRVFAIRGVPTRVYFKSCHCSLQESGCLDHITTRGRLKQILQLADGIKGEGVDQTWLELVNLEAVGFKDLTPSEAGTEIQVASTPFFRVCAAGTTCGCCGGS